MPSTPPNNGGDHLKSNDGVRFSIGTNKVIGNHLQSGAIPPHALVSLLIEGDGDEQKLQNLGETSQSFCTFSGSFGGGIQETQKFLWFLSLLSICNSIFEVTLQFLRIHI